MIDYAETVHGPIGLRQRGAMSGATVPASSPPVTARHRAHARGTPASWCPPTNDRGRALTRISANLVARGCKGIYVPACAVKYPTLLLRPLSRSSSGLCVGGLPARGWWCGVCPSPRWILTPRRYSPKCLEGLFSEVRLNGVLRSSPHQATLKQYQRNGHLAYSPGVFPPRYLGCRYYLNRVAVSVA